MAPILYYMEDDLDIDWNIAHNINQWYLFNFWSNWHGMTQNQSENNQNLSNTGAHKLPNYENED
jgi:hypothetical protein